MNFRIQHKRVTRLIQAFAFILLLALLPRTSATPYASGIAVQDGIVTFILNEDADNVTVLHEDGARTEDLGALAAGTHTFTLGAGGTFEIVVRKAGLPGFLQSVAQQIGEDTPMTAFNSPRGVDVNVNPSSPYFGRVYVANSAPGGSFGDGIYVLNPDLTEALGSGFTARTGGLTHFGGVAGSASPPPSGNSPYRVTVGPDDNLYITDWADLSGSVYVADPNVSDGSGKNVLPGLTGGDVPVGEERIHGSIAGVWVSGSLATGDLTLYVIDEDLQEDRNAPKPPTQINSLWQHDIGSAIPGPFQMPALISEQGIKFVSQIMDVTRGPDGKFYVTDRRANGTEPGLFVIEDSTIIWSSLTETRAFTGDPSAVDFFRGAGGVTISARGNYLAVVSYENNLVTVVPLVDGIPNLERRQTFNGFTTVAAGRDIAFDAADNLYVVSSGNARLRAFSPGGETVATTSSAGEFDLEYIQPTGDPTISVAVVDGHMYERLPHDTGSFIFHRAGNMDVDVTISVSLSGSATAGADYETPATTLLIPSGAASARLDLTSIDDALVEGNETIMITLVEGNGYIIGENASATIELRDDDLAETEVVFADNFETDTFSNWTILDASANDVPDYFVLFADDYIAFDSWPLAPNSEPGGSGGLYITVNDDSQNGAVGVNLYPNGQSFSGNYALRFDLALRTGTTATTEHVLVGINHSGTEVNWHRQSAPTAAAPTVPLGGDGLWFVIGADASNLIDYGLFTSGGANEPPALLMSRSSADVQHILPNPPYAGSPGNALAAENLYWADIEVSQVNNLVTLKVNNAVVMTYENTTPYTSGNIMIGYNDRYDSTGGGYAYFDNVRVVRIEATSVSDPEITGIALGANDTLVITVSAEGGTVSNLSLEQTDTLTNPDWQPAPGTVTDQGGGSFQITLQRPAEPIRFYRVARN